MNYIYSQNFYIFVVTINDIQSSLPMRSFALLLLCIPVLLTAQNGGYALSFDGTNDYVTVPHNTILDVTKFTVEMWFYWDNPAATSDVHFLIGKGLEQLEIHTGGGAGSKALRFIPTTGVYLDTETDVFEPNTWNHVAFAFDPSISYYKCYINGAEKTLTNRGANPVSTAVITTSIPLKLGVRDGNFYPLKGRLDEVRLWKSIRTEAEIKANMFRELGTDANLIASYKMSDGSGTSLTDNSGNSNTGTLTNGPTWKLSGAFSGPRQALEFDGSNEYITFGSSSKMNLTTSVSLEAWVKLNSTTTQDFVVGKIVHGGSNYGYGMYINNGNLGGEAGQVTFIAGRSWNFWPSVRSNARLEAGKWYHLAATFDGRYLKIYINGMLDATYDNGSTYTIVDSGDNLKIGYCSSLGNNYFNGAMDEIRVWSNAISADQIRENMMHTLIGNESNLVAYFRMDDTKGATLQDQAATPNNGTLTNMEDTDWTASSAFTTWLGGEGTSWSNAANWSANAAPGAASNVGIYKWPEGSEASTSSAINVGSLMIAPTASPTLDAAISTSAAFLPLKSVSLKVATTNTFGSLVNISNNVLDIPATTKVTVSTKLDNAGTLLLRATDTSVAQLKQDGTSYTQSGTVVLRKDFKVSKGWYFISFPYSVSFSAIKLAGTETTATTGSVLTATEPYADFYVIEYNGQRRDQTGTASVSNSPNWDAVTSGTLQAGKGYAIRVMSDISLDFKSAAAATGMFDSGNKTLTVGTWATNPNLNHRGWNLAGIPYCSAFGLDNLNQGAFYYTYDLTQQDYVEVESGDAAVVYPFDAFFLQAGSSSLTFATVGRALKAPVATQSTVREFDLRLTNGTYTDRARIRLNDEANATYELDKDAIKMLSMNDAVPQLWTVAISVDLAVNSLPADTKECPVALKIPAQGSYTVSLVDNSSLLEMTSVWLVDAVTNTIVDLKSGAYSFESAAGVHANRLKIKLQPGAYTATANLQTDEVRWVKTEEGIQLSGLAAPSSVRVFDLSGRLLAQFATITNHQTLLIPKGLFVLEILNKEQQLRFKISR